MVFTVDASKKSDLNDYLKDVLNLDVNEKIMRKNLNMYAFGG